VRGDPETMGRCHFVLEPLYGLVLEFHYGAAAGADQMVMVLSLPHRLVAGLAIAKLDFTGNALLGKKFECTVDRGVADARVPLAQ
jgi:hypothetical protein